MQLMDAAFPGQIPLSKANFNASYDYEFSSNFKILQTHFVKIKCDKVVPTGTRNTVCQGPFSLQSESTVSNTPLKSIHILFSKSKHPASIPPFYCSQAQKSEISEEQ